MQRHLEAVECGGHQADFLRAERWEFENATGRTAEGVSVGVGISPGVDARLGHHRGPGGPLPGSDLVHQRLPESVERIRTGALERRETPDQTAAAQVCRDCGEPIAEARLNAIPWTRVCITCKEKQKA